MYPAVRTCTPPQPRRWACAPDHPRYRDRNVTRNRRQQISLVNVGCRDDFGAWHPHDDLLRYTENDAPEPSIDDDQPRAIALRERGIDARVE
jgi:hypothetical protein